MKYKSPQVESETDAADAPKRKLDQRDHDIGTGEGSLEVEKEQPPTKASKSGANAVEEDDEVQEDSGYKDEEFEEEDEEDNEEFDEEEEYDEADDENVDFVKEQGGEEEEDQDAEGDEDDEGEAKERVSSKPKLQKVVKEFGRPPLYGTEIAEGRLESSPDTLLAMVMDAMLKSRPISHDLTQRAVNKLIEVGYHDIRKLGESSWEERTMVLKDGGYNRYREQGATNLGDLAEFVNEKYDGDLNNLLKKAHNDRDETRKLIKEIKGLGDLGVDLFFNNAQAVWPSIAPFIDGRSLETADNVGLGTDLDAIYADLGRDSMSMSRLANGLSAVRLEKRQGDLMAI